MSLERGRPDRELRCYESSCRSVRDNLGRGIAEVACLGRRPLLRRKMSYASFLRGIGILDICF